MAVDPGLLTRHGVGTALFAYFIWNIDVNFCSTLTRWKHQVGLPWGILLEFHGGWHLLTALSTYMFMALIEFLTTAENEQTMGVGFKWPAKAILGSMGSKHTDRNILQANGHANGYAKGYANGSLKSRRE